MHRTFRITLTLVALAFLALPVASQTPDSETPAVETVCDPLRDATPGLYGLCVAYCESHDGDIDLESGEPRDNSVANEKILENYNKRKTAGDPDMPCLRTDCPCFDEADLAALDLDVCRNLSRSGEVVSLQTLTTATCPRGGGSNVDSALASTVPGLRCAYQNTEPTCEILTSVSLQTTLNEFTACQDLLLAEAARRGITCF